MDVEILRGLHQALNIAQLFELPLDAVNAQVFEDCYFWWLFVIAFQGLFRIDEVVNLAVGNVRFFDDQVTITVPFRKTGPSNLKLRFPRDFQTTKRDLYMFGMQFIYTEEYFHQITRGQKITSSLTSDE